MSHCVGNEPSDSLNGNNRGWFIRGIPSFPAEKQQALAEQYIEWVSCSSGTRLLVCLKGDQQKITCFRGSPTLRHTKIGANQGKSIVSFLACRCLHDLAQAQQEVVFPLQSTQLVSHEEIQIVVVFFFFGRGRNPHEAGRLYLCLVEITCLAPIVVCLKIGEPLDQVISC